MFSALKITFHCARRKSPDTSTFCRLYLYFCHNRMGFCTHSSCACFIFFNRNISFILNYRLISLSRFLFVYRSPCAEERFVSWSSIAAEIKVLISTITFDFSFKQFFRLYSIWKLAHETHTLQLIVSNLHINVFYLQEFLVKTCKEPGEPVYCSPNIIDQRSELKCKCLYSKIKPREKQTKKHC